MDVVHLHDGIKDGECLLEGGGVGGTLVYLTEDNDGTQHALFSPKGAACPLSKPPKILTHTSVHILNCCC